MPASDSLNVSKLLSRYAAGAAQSLKGFAWDKAAPRIPSDEQRGKILKFNVGDFRRVFADKLGPGAKVKRSDFRATQDSFYCQEIAAGTTINLREKHADPIAKIEMRKTRYVLENMWMKIEQMFCAKFTSSSVAANWGGTKAGGDGTGGTFLTFDNDGSSPIREIMTAKGLAKIASGGYDMNTMIVDYDVDLAFKTNPEILQRIVYTGSDPVDHAALAKYFEVENYIVTSAVYNSANKGQSTNTFGFINSGKTILLCYVDPNPAIDDDQPTAMLTPWWTDLQGGAEGGIQIKSRLDADTDEIVIEGKCAPDMHMVDSKCGYMLTGCVP
jgi:hypothetical protein